MSQLLSNSARRLYTNIEKRCKVHYATAMQRGFGRLIYKLRTLRDPFGRLILLCQEFKKTYVTEDFMQQPGR